MTKKQEESIRMSFPEDTFNKRQFQYFGDAFHEMHNLPGEYLHNLPTELQKPDGGKLECDVVYLATMPDGSKFVVNVEDESSNVRQKELQKAYDYKALLICKHWVPVLSLITTPVPLEKCSKEFYYSKTDFFAPMIDSFPYMGAWKDLNNMIDRIKNNEVFTKTEGLYFITLPRCCKHDQEKAVEKICEVLLDINIEDHFAKIELVYCMQCLIHKYAKTDDDIKRLQKVIGLDDLVAEKRTILDETRLEGEARGKAEIKQEYLDIFNSLDSERQYTVEELAGKFGFTADELSKGK